MSAGLVYPPSFLSSLPTCVDRPKPFPPVRRLSAPDFARLHAKHLLRIASPDVPQFLFPYLHGIEYGSQQMRQYFASPASCLHPSRANPSNAGEGGTPPLTFSSLPIRPPDFRGLISVVDDSGDDDYFDEDDGLQDEMLVDEDELNFRRPSDTSIQSSPSNYSLLRTSRASSTAPSIASTTVTSFHASASDESSSRDTMRPLYISGTFRVSELISGNKFLQPKVPDMISLRNFDIQVAAYARISDMVVYNPRRPGITSSLLRLANRLAEAHEALYHERAAASGENDPPPIVYNIFVLDSDPSQLPSRLLARCPSFSQLEQIEMQRFTAASEILPGIFLGNTADVPVWTNHECTTNVFDNANNPYGYDLVVECMDGKVVTLPSHSHLKKADDHLTTLQSLWGTGFTSTPPSRPPPNAHSVLHLLFPCSPSLQAPIQHIIAFISFIQSLIHPSHSNRRCKILIYSQDGYTETSVLALTLLMAEHKYTLPEAYLELQLKHKRSFFVHSTDLPLLLKLQTKFHSSHSSSLGKSSLSWSRSRDKERDRWPWSSFVKTDSQSLTEKDGLGPLGLRFGRRSITTANSSSSTQDCWFQNPKFDGAFPSRILPFLYLGNLNHATNAHMLHALGITHVVSVGETALISPEDLSLGAAGTLWLEAKEHRIKVLDIKNVCDDGMDGIFSQLGLICDWIDQARSIGGKILVHCRVGVSRSATVTIAYVMRHSSLPLKDAYLFVRSRRLSVLIQPNLRLLFDLLAWEVCIARERLAAQGSPIIVDSFDEEDSLILLPEEETLAEELGHALNWPFLAREIHRLNAKYIR